MQPLDEFIAPGVVLQLRSARNYLLRPGVLGSAVHNEVLPCAREVAHMAEISNKMHLSSFSPLISGNSMDSGSSSIANDASMNETFQAQVKPISYAIKRVFDITFSFLLLLLVLPVFLIIACLIWNQRDGGGVFYGQVRIGRNGIPFRCLKFRSMCPDAEIRLNSLLQNDSEARLEWEKSHKLLNDPRVTPLGRFIRTTSLDELPQLLNVIRGEMSLVGPRPVTESELDGAYVRFHGREEYLSIRPGITGLWQVSGRSLASYRDRVALDKKYVRELSLAADLIILFRTIGVVCLRRGAV
jgi:exopolysaccharide production protein ExoY